MSKEDAKWYVIHTYSGYENKVATNLEKIIKNRNLSDLICEVKIPTEVSVEIQNDKPVEVERKIFPSYVLVKMILTDETWYIVKNVRGCTGFVGPSSKPVPLTDDEVASMGVEHRAVNTFCKVGDTVKINKGPLKDFIGSVEFVDIEKNLIKLTISMFGRETPVELELGQVELV